jgi:hypothetical protein
MKRQLSPLEIEDISDNLVLLIRKVGRNKIRSLILLIPILLSCVLVAGPMHLN